jgi:aspartyl-tRNA(Asn)/glutamyl-tRNA(Gln) amidotransferase subunit C
MLDSPNITVSKIAELARLELSKDEIEAFQPQLEAILKHVDTLKNLPLSAVPITNPDAFGLMREDIPHESLDSSLVLQNAPDQAQGQIRVPKVVADA